MKIVKQVFVFFLMYNLTEVFLFLHSDCSIGSAGSLSKNAIYQDANQLVNRENRVATPVIDPKMSNNIQDPISSQVPVQLQLVDSVSVQNQQQQQFIPSTHHYIQHHPAAVPMSSSYYPMYLHPQTQHTDPQQYPMYFLPPLTDQTHQPSYDAPIVASSRPLTPPVYPTKPENTHQMGSTGMLVQVPAHQYQQQHYINIGLSQIPPPPQSNAASASAAGANYGYEYSHHHMQDQAAYYAASAPTPQYHTMNPAAAVMFSQASSQQLPADTTAQQS